MGAAKSRNLINLTMSVLTDISTNMMQKIDLRNEQSQLLSFRENRGDIILDGTTQRLNGTIYMSGLMKALSTTEAKTTIAAQLDQTAKSLVSGINLGQFSDAENKIEAYIKAVLNLTTNITQDCAGYSNQTQQISFYQNYGRIIVTNTLQDATSSLLANCLYDALASSTAISELQAALNQAAVSESKGLSEWAIITLAFIGLLTIVLPIVIPLAVGASVIMTYFMIIVGFLLIFGGGR